MTLDWRERCRMLHCGTLKVVNAFNLAKKQSNEPF
jgi:hypothetical protein